MKYKLENKDGLIGRKLQCQLFTVEVDKYGLFHFERNDKGAECILLQLLINTSNINGTISKELIAKLCAIGYLNTPGNNRKGSMVILKNNIKGRYCFLTTLFANIFTPRNSKFLHCTKKNINNIIPEDYSCFIIDNVGPYFNYFLLFRYVAADWRGYDLNHEPFLIPVEKTPKILVVTNSEKLRSLGLSFDRRSWILTFSDFYNEKNKPVFNYTLRDQLINDCIDCYKHFGKIQS